MYINALTVTVGWTIVLEPAERDQEKSQILHCF